MERFIGKIAIVTGAGSGIGECISQELIKRSIIVIGLDINFEKSKLTHHIGVKSKSGDSKFHPLKCDLSNEEDIQKTFSHINETIGVPSILVNNAGIIIRRNIEDVKGQDFDGVFGINSKALLLTSREAIKLMNKNSIAGHILNIISVAGLYIGLDEDFMLYTASKHASRVFSEIMRRANTEKKQNIKISYICPGVVKTPLAAQIPEFAPFMDDQNTYINPLDVARACISVLDTPPTVLISQLTVMPIHESNCC